MDLEELELTKAPTRGEVPAAPPYRECPGVGLTVPLRWEVSQRVRPAVKYQPLDGKKIDLVEAHTR